MLDEIRELELYAFDPDDDASFPLEGAILRPFKKGRKDDFTCVPHALETVARQSLFYDGASAEDAALRADDAIEVLRDWCGFASKEANPSRAPGLEHCHDWMKRYIRAYYRRHSGYDPQALLRAWNGHREGYKKGLFTRQSLTASDANDVSYEIAIARALRKGPLRRWAMVGKLVPEEVCTAARRKGDGFSKLNVANGSTALMLVGMWLMGVRADRRVPESGFVPINLQELYGWIGRRKEIDRGTIESWFYDGEQLFVQDSEISGVKPWKVSQAWLDDGQWQLIDITDGDEPLRAFCREHAGEGFRCYLDADYTDPGFKMGPLKSLVSFASADFV